MIYTLKISKVKSFFEDKGYKIRPNFVNGNISMVYKKVGLWGLGEELFCAFSESTSKPGWFIVSINHSKYITEVENLLNEIYKTYPDINFVI